jgi:replicative DNA helicase
MDNTFYTDERHERWLEIALELHRRAFAQEAPELIYDWLVNRITKLQPDTAGKLSTFWEESFTLYDQEIKRRIEISKLPEAERNIFNFPWSSWNNLIDPAEGGLLIILSGPDGAGKTTYAECIAEHWARRGQHVVFVHFELSKVIMFDRRAVRHTAIARRRLKLAGDLSPEDLYQLEKMKTRLLQWSGGITYLHTPGKSIELVLRELDNCKAEGLCDAVIVDYLEKSSASAAQLKQYGSNVYAREAADVELLKSWSEINDVPTMALSQFNKAGKHSSFEDLDRTMIRGAGEKTEKANVVVMLQPDKKKPNCVNVLVDKNTLGAKGNFQQYFDAANYSVGDFN